MKSYTLHDLPVDERPRERLVKYGVESLSLQEFATLSNKLYEMQNER